MRRTSRRSTNSDMNCTGQAELLVLVQLRQFASERDALLAQLANIATHSPMSPERMDAVCDSWFPEYRSASDNPLWSLQTASDVSSWNPSDGWLYKLLPGLNAQMFILFPWYPFCANERSSCQRGLKGLHALPIPSCADLFLCFKYPVYLSSGPGVPHRRVWRSMSGSGCFRRAKHGFACRCFLGFF